MAIFKKSISYFVFVYSNETYICNLFFFASATFYFSPFSGNAAENLTKILQGQRIGTLFHKDAHKWVPSKEVDVREMAVAARDCSRRLQVSFIF
jgi:hypothetical protein